MQSKMQLAFAQRFKQQNQDRDMANKSKVSSLKGDSKHGMFNHDIPLSPRGYDYDQGLKNPQLGIKGGSLGSDQRTNIGDTMASVDMAKSTIDKPHLISPEIATGSVHILKGSGIDDFT
jgi:hypothetical protein